MQKGKSNVIECIANAVDQDPKAGKRQVRPRAVPIVTIRPVFLARPEAAAYLSISESTIDTLVAAGDLAKPRKISPARTGWLVTDLDEFARTRPVSDLLPPRNAGYGRAGKPDQHARANFPACPIGNPSNE